MSDASLFRPQQLQLPFDGNPHKAMGLIAHPGEVSSLTVSGDGNYLVTAGGTDLTVNVWKINTQALQARRLPFFDDLGE